MTDNFQLPVDDFPIDHHRAGDFLRFIHADSFIKVKRKPMLPSGACYWNVAKFASQFGGKSVYGWMIEWVPGLTIEAMHHAIYQTPEGELIDITFTSGLRHSNYTTFIPSDEVSIDLLSPPRIPRKNYPLVDDADLTRHLYLYDKHFSAHTKLVNALINGGYSSFQDGQLTQIKDVTNEFERKFKPEIEKTFKEGKAARKKLIEKYFKKN